MARAIASATWRMLTSRPAADVERLPGRLRVLQRQHERLRHVLHMHEIAPLLAILEHHRPLAVQQAGREDGQHAGVGVRQRLPGPVHVEQPQGHALHPVRRRDRQGQPLLGVFRQRIDGGEVGRLPSPASRPGRAARRPAPAGPTRRRGAGRARARRRARSPASVRYRPLAVDAHGGRDHDPSHRVVDQRLEQHRRADVVDRDVALDRIHALPDADLGRQVDHLVDALQRGGHRASRRARPPRSGECGSGSGRAGHSGRGPDRSGCPARGLRSLPSAAHGQGGNR